MLTAWVPVRPARITPAAAFTARGANLLQFQICPRTMIKPIENPFSWIGKPYMKNNGTPFRILLCCG
jgi:hypothetical protein